MFLSIIPADMSEGIRVSVCGCIACDGGDDGGSSASPLGKRSAIFGTLSPGATTAAGRSGAQKDLEIITKEVMMRALRIATIVPEKNVLSRSIIILVKSI